MPKMKELASEHEDQGLVLIGIHTENGAENMEQYVAENEIAFPVCVDTSGTIAAWGADSYPDYAIVDRQGILRVADLANGGVEHAVEVLLGEYDHLSAAAARAYAQRDGYSSAVFDLVMQDGTVLGEFEFGGALEEIDGDRVLAFADSLRIELPGAERTMELSFAGAMELGPRLTPVHLTVTDEDGQRAEADVAVEGATWSLDWGEGAEVTELPAGTLMDMSIFHLLPGMPEEEGFAFEAPWFELEDADLRGFHRVENMGREELEHHGETVKAWRWAVTDLDAEGATRTKLELWTAKGELLEADFDGKRLVRRKAE